MKKTTRLALLSAACLAVGVLAFSQTDEDPLDALKICTTTQKLVFENRWVRILENNVPAGAAEPLHSHPHGVIIYLEHSKNEVTTPDGKKRVSENNAGTAVWSEASLHAVKNIGEAATRTIRVDIKY